MKKIFLMLTSLLCSSLIFAAEDNNQNHILLINNQDNLNMIVSYSNCYRYDSVLWGENSESCDSNTVTLYAKNNPKGPRFYEIKWDRYSSSTMEYVKITNVTLTSLDGTKRLNVDYTDPTYTYSWSPTTGLLHTAIVFVVKKVTLHALPRYF